MPTKKRSSIDCLHDYKFNKDETILVLPQLAQEDIYEAKVVERKFDRASNEPQYKIHYKGWNKRWDEWVGARRLLKSNAENIRIMHERKATNVALGCANSNSNASPMSKREDKSYTDNDTAATSAILTTTTTTTTATAPPSATVAAPPAKRRKLNNGTMMCGKADKAQNEGQVKPEKETETPSDSIGDCDKEKDYDAKKENKKKIRSSASAFEIKLPSVLKRLLIADWQKITKNNQLIELPRLTGCRISDILREFEDYAIKQGQDSVIIKEVIRGIKDYFNQALSVTLLYKSERAQFETLRTDYKDIQLHDVYGAEHLCRLFVKLPQLLSPNELDTDTKQILKQQIEFMIHFILDNQGQYFCTMYVDS